MSAIVILVGLGFAAIAIAAWRHRRTSLTSALLWSLLVPPTAGLAVDASSALTSYAVLAALSLTTVAVLGARHPGAPAWNAVVAALGIVFVVPAARSALMGTPFAVEVYYRVLVAALVGTGVVNYLFTRFAPAAILASVSVTPWLFTIWDVQPPASVEPLGYGLLGTPLVAAGCAMWPMSANEFDRRWRWFRDRWGAVWALRAREQFNAAAANRDQPFKLSWAGLQRPVTGSDDAEALRLLNAVIGRFVA